MLTVELTSAGPDKVEPLAGFVRHRVMVYSPEGGELVLHAGVAAAARSGSRTVCRSKDPSTSRNKARIISLRT